MKRWNFVALGFVETFSDKAPTGWVWYRKYETSALIPNKDGVTHVFPVRVLGPKLVRSSIAQETRIDSRSPFHSATSPQREPVFNSRNLCPLQDETR